MNKCRICFIEISSGRKYCTNDHYKTCKACNKEFVVKSLTSFDKVKSCSPSCRSKLSHSPESKAKREKNSLEKYGTLRPQQAQEVKNKAINTNKERYGEDYPNQNQKIRAKGYATNLKKYGVKHPLQNQELKEKAQKTLEEKYGVKHPSEAPELRERAQETLFEKYGVKHSWQAEEVKEKIKKHYQNFYGKDYPSQVPEIRAKTLLTLEKNIAAGLYPNYNRISKINRRWASKIKEKFNCEIIFEKALANASFDLYLPEHNILIDINPTVSHNSEISFVCLISDCALPCQNHEPLKTSYHYDRAVLARENGYTLVQIYDWDSEEKILNFLAGKITPGYKKYSARQLKLEKISPKEANNFLEKTHIQGSARSQTYCYGLKDNAGELLSVATFGKARFGAKADCEWVRYAVKSGVIIHGGSQRLFRAFTAETPSSTVVSYVDFNHTTAPRTFMESCGFKEEKPTGASLIWSKNEERIYNNSLLQLGADRLLKTSYGKPSECGLKNVDIMLIEGWLPVYTSGNRVFRYTSGS